MRFARAALLLAGFAPAALGQPELPRTVTGDIDGDGVADRVELRRADEPGSFVDVTVFLSKDKQTVRVKSLAGAEAIEQAAIDKGQLVLAFGWVSGRYKSQTEFFIGLQGGQLVVRRYRLAVADSVSTNKDGTIKVDSCDADFVAGRALRNDKPAAAPGRPVALAAWNDDAIPVACQF